MRALVSGVCVWAAAHARCLRHCQAAGVISRLRRIRKGKCRSESELTREAILIDVGEFLSAELFRNMNEL